MPTNTEGPYWLIREPGRDHGFGTLEFDGDTDPATALARFWQKMGDDDAKMRHYLVSVENDPGVTATLVTMTMINGQPSVNPVKVPA